MKQQIYFLFRFKIIKVFFLFLFNFIIMKIFLYFLRPPIHISIIHSHYIIFIITIEIHLYSYKFFFSTPSVCPLSFYNIFEIVSVYSFWSCILIPIPPTSRESKQIFRRHYNRNRYSQSHTWRYRKYFYYVCFFLIFWRSGWS